MPANETVERRIEETTLPDRRLGRHVLHDVRSRDYPASRSAKIISVKHSAVGLPLNQGSIGSCTANALCGALNSAPDSEPGFVYHENNAVTLYELETKLEGQPYPPNDPGGTGLMVCKAARQLGWIKSYRHAFGVQHALEALVIRPVITGVNWYSSFDSPDPETGLVAISSDATVRGGHEIVADEIDAENRLVYLWNSWGPDWGQGGRFCWSFDTWDQLLVEEGDVTVPQV